MGLSVLNPLDTASFKYDRHLSQHSQQPAEHLLCLSCCGAGILVSASQAHRCQLGTGVPLLLLRLS